ncbi:hypothetical protein [Phyllobacterium endophyticum]|nr:hypothetical protein [Phyllobacterium endophyticum]
MEVGDDSQAEGRRQGFRNQTRTEAGRDSLSAIVGEFFGVRVLDGVRFV